MSRTPMLVAIGIGLVVGLVGFTTMRVHQAFEQQRRQIVHDRQAAFHSSEVFHVVGMLRLAHDGDIIAALNPLYRAVEDNDHAEIVYAGEVIVNALSSEQLSQQFNEDVAWSASILIQFESKDHFEQFVADPTMQQAVAPFDAVYWQGMKRSAIRNLMLPQIINSRRLFRTVTFKRKIMPFIPAEIDPRRMSVREELARASLDRGKDAIVIVNFTKDGTSAERKADAAYLSAMLDLMSEVNNGPIHTGDSVTVEGNAEFDYVALVYYPGSGYFNDMTGSTFYQSIYTNKQVADTQSSITVPVLHLLH
ncbi:MAG: hypothetical protein AAFX52_14915 [Pseudomonadota bacterium]